MRPRRLFRPACLPALALSLAFLAMTVLLPGCTAPTDRPDPTGVVVLIDVSGSTNRVRDDYLTNFSRVLDGLKGGERLFVIPLTASSLVEPVVAEAAVPERTWSTTEFVWQREKRQQDQALLDQVAALLEPSSQPRRPGSAILDGIQQAAEVLRPYRERQLVIISDMIEQSDLADFSVLEESEIESLLLTLQDRAPDLNARVHVAGITDGSTDLPLPSPRVLAIRAFWSAFFAERGCSLVEYGPTLLTFGRDG